MPICRVAVLASQRQWYARRSAERVGASGDEPGARRPGGTGRAARGRLRRSRTGRVTPEPPPSLRDPDPPR